MILAILVFVGFYMLAHRYDKKPILWGLIGVASTFILQFIGGLLLGVYLVLTGNQVTKENLGMFSLNTILVTIVSLILMGIFYLILKKKWHKEYLKKEEEENAIYYINDIENTDEY